MDYEEKNIFFKHIKLNTYKHFKYIHAILNFGTKLFLVIYCF